MKNKIVIAALRLFLLRGYKYVSLVDVAQEVGITKGGIYHYFENKERLLYAAVQHLFEHVRAHIIDLFQSEQNLRDVLYALLVDRDIENYVENMINVKCPEDVREVDEVLFRLEIMQHFPRLHEQIDKDQMELCLSLKTRLEKAMRTGEIRADVNAESLAILTWTLLNGQKSTPLFFYCEQARRQTFEALCQILALK